MVATGSNEPHSRQNQNYITLDKLLKEVAVPVVRKIFDKEFHPAVLQATLNKESVKIKKFTNDKQRNILFPQRDKKTVCSSDFDLTLMILMISNLTEIPISKMLPVPNDTSQGADLSRIKYSRNELAHCNGKISDIEFEQQWVEIFQAVVRLGGESYKEICAQLKITSLSSGKGYGMKNIHKKVIEDWKEIDSTMVETNDMKELMKVTKTSNFIAVTGDCGCGKDTTIHHVALLLCSNQGYQIIPSHCATDITNYYNELEKQVFVFEDVCGKHAVDSDLCRRWNQLSAELTTIKKCENVMILMSSRTDLYDIIKYVPVLSATEFQMSSKNYDFM